jgi:hypothetical protein
VARDSSSQPILILSSLRLSGISSRLGPEVPAPEPACRVRSRESSDSRRGRADEIRAATSFRKASAQEKSGQLEENRDNFADKVPAELIRTVRAVNRRCLVGRAEFRRPLE